MHLRPSQIERGDIASGKRLLIGGLSHHCIGTALLLLFFRDGQRIQPVIPVRLAFGLLRRSQFTIDVGLSVPECDLKACRVDAEQHLAFFTA